MESLQSGYFYHIYNHANGNEILFRNDNNYKFFLKKYEHYISPIADTFAYCLMPNHFHFLIRIKENILPDDIKFGKETSEVFKTSEVLASVNKVSNAFKNLFISYTKAYNKLYSREGSLFRPKFRRKIITSDKYLKQAIIYIHQNPVHHDFVQSPELWRHSSFHAYFSSRATKLNKNEVIEWFDDLKNFEECHKMKTSEIYASKMELDY